MIDFSLFPKERFCRGHAWAWLVQNARDGDVEFTVRALAAEWRWPSSSVARFLDEIHARGLGTVCGTRGRTGGTILTIGQKSETQPPRGKAVQLADQLPDQYAPAAAELATALDLYQRAAGKAGWPLVRDFSKARKAKVGARLREHGLPGWREMLVKAYQTPLLRGDNERGWKPTGIDWFANPTNFAKVLEGAWGSDADARPTRSTPADSVADAVLRRPPRQ